MNKFEHVGGWAWGGAGGSLYNKGHTGSPPFMWTEIDTIENIPFPQLREDPCLGEAVGSLYSKVPSWGGGLYYEAQCIVGNGHMGLTPFVRTDRQT